MCFTKTGPGKHPKVAENDIFVVKTGYAKSNEFLSSLQGFTYKKGKIYRKWFLSKWLAKRRISLHGEVYHCHSVGYSRELVRNAYGETTVGVFRIPKGTTYFRSYEEIATFSIEYIGPLSMVTKELVLQQKSHNEIVRMAEGQTSRM